MKRFSVFANSLLDTTIQDNGRRKRSDCKFNLFIPIFSIFLYQQFITQSMMADYDNYIITTYIRTNEKEKKERKIEEKKKKKGKEK